MICKYMNLQWNGSICKFYFHSRSRRYEMYSLPFLLMQWNARICVCSHSLTSNCHSCWCNNMQWYVLNGYALNGYVLNRYVLNPYVLSGYVLNRYTLKRYVWHDVYGCARYDTPLSSEKPCDETSFGKKKWLKKKSEYPKCYTNCRCFHKIG